jgi:hypothetical protein
MKEGDKEGIGEGQKEGSCGRKRDRSRMWEG